MENPDTQAGIWPRIPCLPTVVSLQVTGLTPTALGDLSSHRPGSSLRTAAGSVRSVGGGFRRAGTAGRCRAVLAGRRRRRATRAGLPGPVQRRLVPVPAAWD